MQSGKELNRIIIEIRPLPTHIQVSKHINKVYWHYKDKRIPKKITEGLKLRKIIIGTDGFFRDKISNTRILKNTKSHGKPRLIPINNQLIYNNTMKHEQRSLYVKKIKESLKPFFLNLKPLKPEQFPIQIDGIIQMNKTNENWDLDNLNSIYSKTIQDLMVELSILPGDSVQYISKCMSLEYRGFSEIPSLTLIIKTQ